MLEVLMAECNYKNQLQTFLNSGTYPPITRVRVTTVKEEGTKLVKVKNNSKSFWVYYTDLRSIKKSLRSCKLQITRYKKF